MIDNRDILIKFLQLFKTALCRDVFTTKAFEFPRTIFDGYASFKIMTIYENNS